MKTILNFRNMQDAQVRLFPGSLKNSLQALFLVLVLNLNAAENQPFSEPLFQANIFLQDSQKLIFSQTNEIIAYADSTALIHRYYNPDGSLAALDEVVLINHQIKRAFTKFYQVGEEGEVIRKNDKMLMRFKKNNETKTKLFDFPDDLIVGPLFNNFVQENWQTLLNGRNLHIKLPAPGVMRIATFTFRKVNSDYAGERQVAFKLSPTNLILKIFISASYFVYNLDSRRLEKIHGNSILKTEINGSFTNTTNVDIFYSYPSKEQNIKD